MRRILGALCTLTIVVGGAATAGAAVGGESDPTMTVAPSSGPAGSTFTVSGSECTAGDGGTMSVEVSAPDTVEVSDVAIPDESGDWSLDLTVPDDADVASVIDIDADCIETFNAQTNAFQGIRAPSGNDGVLRFSYAQAEFTVTATPTTETPTTEVPTTDSTPTSAPDGDVDGSDAAAPVVAQPTFTG